MMFTITRLCGGKALMAASHESMNIDLERASEILKNFGTVKNKDEMMLIADWNGIELTIYPQGNIMFHPLSDKDLAVKYATEILERLR
ncbi:MAG: hypothetical protein WC248_01520 [Candidatus Methanomethylophilaceae archaeon]